MKTTLYVLDWRNRDGCVSECLQHDDDGRLLLHGQPVTRQRATEILRMWRRLTKWEINGEPVELTRERV